MSSEMVAVTPDWHNADTCIENMQIAYDDALEADPFDDGNSVPTDTVVSAGDLGVLIDLARHAVTFRQQAEARATSGAGEQRDRIAGMIALAGLGTNTGEPRRPHDSWQADEFETRIMDIVPTRVVDQCYALADRILALSASPTEAPGSEGAGSVTISRERYDRLRFAAGEIDSDPGLAAVAGESRSALTTAMAPERRAFAAPTRLALNEQGEG